MRVGVVTTSFPRWPGDHAGSFVAGHAAWLARRGHDVEVIAAPSGEPLFYRGGAPEALEGASARTIARAARFSAAQLHRVRRASRRWDAIVAHWLVPSAAAAALGGRGLPLLAVAHSGDVHLLRRAGLAPAVARLLVARGARVAFAGEATRDALLAALAPALARRVRARAIVTPMGIDAARFARLAPPPAGAVREVLFVGRLVAIKGVDVLIDAVARLGDRARLTVAGDGPERAHLERRAAGRGVAAVFRGEVGARERDRLLGACDVVVVPSRPRPDGRTEGTPVIALEALAAGRAVVAARTGGLASLPVTRVAPGDAGALAAAIASATPHPEGRAFARAHDWEQVGSRLWGHAFPPGAAVPPLSAFQ